MSSSSSTELAEIAGFRIERELGRGSRSVVYEALQVNLDRPVALKLVLDDDGAGTLDWPEHPRVVSLYATGPWEGSRFVAMQLVQGPTLAQLVETGGLGPARALELLADVAEALDAAHRARSAHGAVAAANVLVDGDGHALLSDFGLGAAEPTVAGDRADFLALARACLGDRAPALSDPGSFEAGEIVRLARSALPAPRRRRLPAVAAGTAAVAAAATLVAVLAGADPSGDRVPQPAPGAVALGSELAAGRTSSVDCSGRSPSGGSQACTVVQTQLPGRALVPSTAGVVRRWLVRGARGEIALQVIRRQGNRYVSVARSRFESIPDEGVHVLRADLGVRGGDLLGVQLAPGAAIGVRRGVPGATTARWLGQLLVEPRAIELGPGTGFDDEILLRADYTRGARPRVSGALSGRRAERAPAGRVLSSGTVEIGGVVRRVAVVGLADSIAVDLLAGHRRLARLRATEVDPAGRLVNFTALGFGYAVLRWRNPDGRTVVREYGLDARGLRPRG
jgi:Protein kinase domain